MISTNLTRGERCVGCVDAVGVVWRMCFAGGGGYGGGGLLIVYIHIFLYHITYH